MPDDLSGRRFDDELMIGFRDRLNGVENAVSKLTIIKETEQRFLQDTLSSMRSLLEKHDRILIGDGEGLTAKVKIIQESENERRAHRFVLYTGVIGLIVDRIWNIFIGGKP